MIFLKFEDGTATKAARTAAGDAKSYRFGQSTFSLGADLIDFLQAPSFSSTHGALNSGHP